MADDTRFDLSVEIEKESDRALRDIEAAAREVKRQMAQAAENKRQQSEKARSKRISAVAVAIGAVVVLLIAYWVVFARPDSNTLADQRTPPRTSSPVTIVTPEKATKTVPAAPDVRGASGQLGRDSQVVEHPPDEFEQPSADPGM